MFAQKNHTLKKYKNNVSTVNTHVSPVLKKWFCMKYIKLGIRLETNMLRYNPKSSVNLYEDEKLEISVFFFEVVCKFLHNVTFLFLM